MGGDGVLASDRVNVRCRLTHHWAQIAVTVRLIDHAFKLIFVRLPWWLVRSLLVLIFSAFFDRTGYLVIWKFQFDVLMLYFFKIWSYIWHDLRPFFVCWRWRPRIRINPTRSRYHACFRDSATCMPCCDPIGRNLLFLWSKRFAIIIDDIDLELYRLFAHRIRKLFWKFELFKLFWMVSF